MATVVSITNPITGAVEQVDKLDHTAQQIDDAVALAPQISNPNLLDNWYFGNPVNQRGQTEYVGSGYTFDRWLLNQWNTTRVACSIVTNGLRVRGEASGSCSTSIKQFVEGLKAGCQVTASVLVTDFTAGAAVYLFIRTNSGVRLTRVHFSAPGLYSVTTTLPDDFEGNLMIEIGQGGSDGGNRNTDFTVLATKLELGSQQTLAHQDADGNWVLNEIPNYEEQLARCQRYLFVPTTQTDSIYNLAIGVGTSTTTIAFFLPLPTTMRAKSSITFSGLHAVNEINSMLAITKVANYGQVSNGVWLQTTVASGAEVGKAYYLRTSNPWSLVLDANL